MNMMSQLNSKNAAKTMEEYVYISKYSKFLHDQNRRETWAETVKRYKANVLDRHLSNEMAEIIARAILNLEVVPSMRMLATAGPALDRDNVCGYNCAYKAITQPRDFSDALFILSSGTGMGYSVEKKYISQLPKVPSSVKMDEVSFTVQDSREGWQEAVQFAMEEGFLGNIYEYDLSLLRPEGAILKTFGGRSSGPEPLRKTLNYINDLFKKAAGRQLTSLECHDLMCMIASCIVAGGVRRSAMISLGDIDDVEMRNAKNWSLGAFPEERHSANNSYVTNGTPSKEEFEAEWSAMVAGKSGERGIFNRASAKAQAEKFGRKVADFGCNPCSEILLVDDGQFCNLSEVIIRADDDFYDLKRKVELATIIGTVQSTFTHFPALPKNWTDNCEEERLLGVSMTGIMDNPLTNGVLAGLPGRLNELRNFAIDTNKKWAEKLGISAAASVTCVKPSGSVSALTGTASGIHSRWSDYYIRRTIQSNADPLTQLMIDEGIPHEPSATKPDLETVFSFPIASPLGAVTNGTRSAIEQMEMWLTYQRNWTTHKVSATISVKSDEWDDLAKFVYDHFDEIAGVSFLPYDDHAYVQAPYEQISAEKYEELNLAFPISVNWSRLPEFEIEDTTKASQELACTGGACEIL
ncbi:MAG: recombinase [Proteobacteria bacterium]|nr:recombinase [Pseudomonadota bacterium]